MVIQPALPLYFIDVLNLTYTDLAIALTVCKGIGFAISSPLWGRGMDRMSVPIFTTLIFLFMGSFPLLLLLAPHHLFWVYIAYLLYGVSQAGSHLLWNLSGPLFAKGKDSSVYTGVNVVMVGVRGAVAPPIGSLLCALSGPGVVLFIGGALFGLGCYYMLSSKRLTLFQKQIIDN
jgi:predicted MFS family arabinose efflux permease